MSALPDAPYLESPSFLQNILDEPEHADLRRLTTLAEHLFHVPVAYMALLGHRAEVVKRIGSGREYWHLLKTHPLPRVLDQPLVIRDAADGLPAGTDFGDLRFAATAPLKSADGIQLGMLVIADRQPRPGFSDQDLQALVELAGVLAGKMELRRIAAHALESELSLREAERRFRGIADFADVLIISAGTDGHGAFVNETWLEFTGRSLEEELGDGWAEVIHPDYQRAVVEGYWQAFRERRPFAAEFSMRRHDGMYRWMQGRARPRFLDDGTFAGYIACIWDVTDYHTATMDLRKQARCTAAVAEAAGLFYLVLDSEGRIEQISPICQRTSGRQPQQMQGCLAWESCTAAQQGAAAVRDAVRQAASSGATVRAPTTYASPSRGEVGLLWTITPIQSERGEASTLVATVFEPGGRDRLAANGESGCACSH